MITIEINDETLNLLAEQYGDEVVSQYQEGVPTSLYDEISEGNPAVTPDELRDAYNAVSDEAVREIVMDNDFEGGIAQVEALLDEFEEHLRRFTARQYALKEGLDEGTEL